jgi:dolichol-phosphate mannosyltransferase
VRASLVSVVLPIHNERENLAPLLAEIRRALKGIAHEIVAVDDGSTDDSLGELERLAGAGPGVRIVRLERRAGQSAAFAAGCDAARGEIIVTMDADGQHDPADVPRMLALLESSEAVSAVAGFRSPRVDSWWKRLQSSIANTLRDGLTRFDGMHRFLPTLIRLNGGTVVQVPVAHRPRRHGQSKYGLLDRALRGLVDALGVRWLKRRALHYRVRLSGTASGER